METLRRCPLDDLSDLIPAKFRDTGATDRAEVRPTDGQARERSRLKSAALFGLASHFNAGPVRGPLPAAKAKAPMVWKEVEGEALKPIFGRPTPPGAAYKVLYDNTKGSRVRVFLSRLNRSAQKGL
jgi:hypothetical protein